MPPRKQSTLLAQGKPRTFGGSRPWRVRLYAPEPGGTKYQVMFRAPAGEGEPWKRVLLPPDYVRRDVELAYATTAYGAQGATVTESHVLVGEHSGAASAYVGMTRGRERNVAHLVAESVEDARKQWYDVFGRARADLGPAHAREAAAEAIERNGPKARKQRPIPSRPPEFDHRRPAPSSSGSGIGF